MGLGKTVEIIDLILLHQRAIPEHPQTDRRTGTFLLPSKGTIIITPPTICTPISIRFRLICSVPVG
jgi:hypothetical protein